LGTGAFCKVYLAVEKATGEEIAVKVNFVTLKKGHKKTKSEQGRLLKDTDGGCTSSINGPPQHYKIQGCKRLENKSFKI
jgi:hypothetical protein